MAAPDKAARAALGGRESLGVSDAKRISAFGISPCVLVGLVFPLVAMPLGILGCRTRRLVVVMVAYVCAIQGEIEMKGKSLICEMAEWFRKSKR